jgi:hypothetical protein
MKLNVAQRELIKGYIQEILNKEHTDPGKKHIKDMHNRLNFACPFCGDSTQNSHNYRGNLFWDSLFYHCYNDGCNKHISLKNFLKTFGFNFSRNPESKFILDYIDNNERDYSNSKIHEFDYGSFPELQELGISFKDFYATYHAKPIEKYDDGYNYLKGRLLHKQSEDFAYNTYGNRLYVLNTDVKREKIIGFQIRNLGKSNDKYLSFNIERINRDMGKDLSKIIEDPDELSRFNKLSTIFNILKVNFEQKLTLFEGPIDAKFMRNSMGLASVGRDKEAFLQLPYKRFFLDNDKAGKRVSIELLRNGNEVFLWRKFIKDFEIDKYLIDKEDKDKDLNDIIKLCYKYNLNAHKHLEEYFTDSPYSIILI